MEKILEQENWDWGFDFYPPDTFNDGEYVLSKYAIFEKCEDGYLLFHTITRAMYLLTYDEFTNMLNNEELIKNYIVLNSNINEDEIAKTTYLKRSQSPVSDFKKLNGYVIFTTNNCNARCKYCYEGNRDTKSIEKGMTLKTAEKLIQYILKTKKEGPFNLHWFGGEPLLNIRIINYITKRLKEELPSEDNTFTSLIITNGLLLTENVLNNAIENWNLKSVQITLDGINEKYNEIKQYKNIKFDPFKKVIKNIEGILEKKDIRLALRINVSEDNINDIDDTLSFLYEKFEPYIGDKNFIIDVRPIFQIELDDSKIESSFSKKIEELQKKYNIKRRRKNTLLHIPLTHCMADIGKTVVVNPKGNISLCEHWDDKNIIGNITDGITNKNIVEEWNKKDEENIEFCNSIKCPYLPICNHLVKCPSEASCKSQKRMLHIGQQYRQLMLDEYQKYKDKKENGEE